MTSRRRLLTTLLAASLLALPFFSACGGGEDTGGGGNGAPEAVVYKLGGVLPTTGPNASVGAEAVNAAQLAVEEWNASGRLPEGVTVEFFVQDDASDPRQAVSAAHLMAGDQQVFGLVAHYNSGCFLPATEVYHGANLMAITPAATNPEITQRGYPEIARVTPHDLVQGDLAARYINANLGLSRVAIVHDRTQYGQGLAEVVRDNAAANNLEIISFSGLTVGERDFNALVATLKSQDPEVVYFGGLYDEAGLLVKQMREQGMTAHFFTDDGAYGQDFFDAAGAAAEGATVSFPGTPLEHLAPAQEFLAKYEERYGEPVQNFGPYAYDAANILLHGLRLALADGISGPRLRPTVVEKVRGLTHDGALGTTSFDENGDTLNRQYSFYDVENGAFAYKATISADGGPAPAGGASPEGDASPGAGAEGATGGNPGPE